MSIRSHIAEFETEDTTTTDTKEPVMNTLAQVANTAIAAAANKPVQRRALQLAFSEYQDAIDSSIASALAVATPTVTGEQGSLYLSRTEDLGTKMVLRLVSFNHRYLIGTGTNDKEASEHLRTSYDGETLEDGTPVKTYLESLRAKGYPGKISPYTDLYGFLTNSEKKATISPDQMVRVQCSKTSAAAWASFCVSRGFVEMSGGSPLTEVEIHAEKREMKGNRYTNFSFHAPK